MNVFKLLPLVGIALFFILLARLDVSYIASTVFNSKPVFLISAVIVTLSLAALKALRWKLLMKPFGYTCPFQKAMKSWLSGFFLSIITPGRIGDLSRALYVKGEIGLGKSLNTVVVDRAVDVISLLLFAVSGAFVLAAAYSQSSIIGVAIALLVAFSCTCIIAARRGSMKFLARPLFGRLVPDTYKSSARITFNEFYEGLETILRNRWGLSVAVVLSIISVFLLSLQYYFIVLALGLDIPYEFMLLVVPLVSVMDTIPISFSGMGTRDISLIFFFSLIGISAEAAISSSIMVLFLGYAFVGFLGFIFWIKNPTGARSFIRNANHHVCT